MRFMVIAPTPERLQELLEKFPAVSVTPGEPGEAKVVIDSSDSLDFLGRAADLGITARSE